MILHGKRRRGSEVILNLEKDGLFGWSGEVVAFESVDVQHSRCASLALLLPYQHHQKLSVYACVTERHWPGGNSEPLSEDADVPLETHSKHTIFHFTALPPRAYAYEVSSEPHPRMPRDLGNHPRLVWSGRTSRPPLSLGPFRFATSILVILLRPPRSFSLNLLDRSAAAARHHSSLSSQSESPANTCHAICCCSRTRSRSPR